MTSKCTPCVDGTKRMPYGELGSVDTTTSCFCCVSFSSDLTPSTAEGGGGVSPGCGCEGALVSEIVGELKKRMKARGDTGNIVRAEQTLAKVTVLEGTVERLEGKIDAMMKHMGVSPGISPGIVQPVMVQPVMVQPSMAR